MRRTLSLFLTLSIICVFSTACSAQDFSFGGFMNTIPTYGTSGPQNQYSEKALEALAALGNTWAQIKLSELYAQRFRDFAYQDYQQTSWFSLFSKIDKYFTYRAAKGQYEDSVKRTQQYEALNPGNFGQTVVEGIDEVSEKVLEFKALFGDKKAKAKLELIRAKRELDRIQWEYSQIPWYDVVRKAEANKRLDLAKLRYQMALQNNNAVNSGGAPIYSSNGRINEQPQQLPLPPVVSPFPAGGVDQVFNQASQVLNQGVVTIKDAREKMEAAYRKYMNALSNGDSMNSVNGYKQEYLDSLKSYQQLNQR